MKTSEFAIAAVAILLAASALGFGIAQAAGIHSERPVLSFAEMQAPEQGSTASSYGEDRPVLSFEDEETYLAARSPAEGLQLENPIETGSLPPAGSAGSSAIEVGAFRYRVGVDTGP